MKFNKFVYMAVASLLLSCSGGDGVDPECAAASEAAEEYYSFLTEGKCDEFVNGFARVNTFPEDYQGAFGKNTEDFIAVQKERHGGITAVDVSAAERDTINNTVNVFLTLSYGDSTTTRVVVPMVKNNDKWLMK